MRASLTDHCEALEAEYIERLSTALRRCAAGRWGLFGHNDKVIEGLGKHARRQLVDPEVVELLAIGEAIAAARKRIGVSEAFEPHRQLLEICAGSSANALGEPKLAQRWLDEMAAAGR
ncbi:hypothetical protein [Glacieibacterium frigidum]|uniref:Uncharacterized protein n=1 Tax=Glacieibacterium frigidum TaxID=2593303 RepID=A0A552U8W9_9SPHN|nr:hypothetical protein [Glacieibacterium frigidum]TRW14661.1 hypothetical protein FMM06_13305 [Glacieibacterium frigidum]